MLALFRGTFAYEALTNFKQFLEVFWKCFL